MHPAIAQRLEYLEVRKEGLLKRLHAMPENKQHMKEDGKYFSPVEVVMHLAMAEQQSVDRMKIKGPKDLIGAKIRTSFIFKKVIKQMKEYKRIAVPANLTPSGRVTVEVAERAWERSRKEAHLFFNEAKHPDDPVMQLFVFGTLSASDLLELFETHMLYHEHYFPPE